MQCFITKILYLTSSPLKGSNKIIDVLNDNGRTLYVGGSGPGNYTSIQDAINDASDGDTIFVFNGTYYENVIIDKSVKLVGENRNTTVIDGGKKKTLLRS